MSACSFLINLKFDPWLIFWQQIPRLFSEGIMALLWFSNFFQKANNLKSRGPILRVMSSEMSLVCVKQALNTCRWLVNALVTWHVSYKITTLFHSPDQHHICTQQPRQKACLHLSTPSNLVLMNFIIRKKWPDLVFFVF